MKRGMKLLLLQIAISTLLGFDDGSINSSYGTGKWKRSHCILVEHDADVQTIEIKCNDEDGQQQQRYQQNWRKRVKKTEQMNECT